MPVKAVGKKIVERDTGKVVGKSSSHAKAQSAATMRNMAHAAKKGYITKEAFNKVKEKAGNTDFLVRPSAPPTGEVNPVDGHLLPDQPSTLSEVAGTDISKVQNIPITAYKGSSKDY